MVSAENGARIKAWGGSSSSTSTKGGGSGYVKNITFEDFTCESVALPIVIDQCYETSASTCASYPSQVNISDVHYISVTGSGTKSYEVVTMVCSQECTDITATGTDLKGTKGSEYICSNIESTADLDFPCDADGVTIVSSKTAEQALSPLSSVR
jgi:Glycosyl hydrolases family 28